jgi:nucleoside-diphosphate-sugar epimerase
MVGFRHVFKRDFLRIGPQRHPLPAGPAEFLCPAIHGIFHELIQMPDNPLASDLNHILDHTRSLWDELRGARLFVTGGTGFIGCWLLESLLWANSELRLGSQVTILTRDPNRFRARAPHLAGHPAVKMIRGDASSFEFPAGQFSYVIHAATETAPGYAAPVPRKTFLSNIEGTRHVLDFCERCGASKLLFTSSGAVYGPQPPWLSYVPEDYLGAPATTDPATAYGQSKRVSEFLLLSSSPSALESKIARCFAFVGPGLPLDANYAIGNFIRDALEGQSIRLEGDGTSVRSYLYAADLTIWLWSILVRGRTGRPYNVGSDKELTIRELAKQVAYVIAPWLGVQVAGDALPGQPAQRYVPSVSRAREELGLQPWIPLAAGIRRTADFYSR